MSEIDVRALETNFLKWRQDRAPDEGGSEAFEVYSIEQVLKDADLSDDELKSGLLGGEDDGGVDAMYLFINRTLIQEETAVPESAIVVELIIIQSKNTKAFSETTIQKLHTFCTDCFDWSKPVEEIAYFNRAVKDAIARFREKYDSLLASQHTFKISFYYVTKSDNAADQKVIARVDALKEYVASQISGAVVDFMFWGCAKLLTSARSIPRLDAVLETTEKFSTNDGSVVCLVNLANFAKFLTDEGSNLKTSILEPNVRDYQGSGSPVNKDIRATLNDTAGGKVDFWWLNNGITIIADKCSLVGNKVTITKPEIVNGLQTSHEVFEAFRQNPGRTEKRNILLRIIVAPEERSRNAIIKATNFQTPVNPVSLRATDRLHFDIEDRLKLYGLFYDRRKGEYKRLKKPIAKIISITSLAQTVMAAFLQRPADARARPATILNREELYSEIFNDAYNRDFYASCVLLDRQVFRYVMDGLEMPREAKLDVHYYVTMIAASEICKTATPDAAAIAAAINVCKSSIDPTLLAVWLEIALAEYAKLGANDKVAKGNELQNNLKKALQAKYPVPGPTPNLPGLSLSAV